MLPFIVLVLATAIFWALGRAGVPVFQNTGFVLRAALALMFLLTASAHWGKRRPDLIRMVPPRFPRPDLLVSITGVLEILGLIGLLIPATARAAAICLALLLLAMFPANVHAARKSLTIGGRRVPPVPVRAATQIVLLAALACAAWLV